MNARSRRPSGPRMSSVEQGDYLRKHKPDYGLSLLTGILLLLSLIVIYSVSPALGLQAGEGAGESYFIVRQLIHTGLGLGAFFIAATIPISWWKSVQPLLIAATIVTTVLLLVPGIGQTVNGATRWIQLGPLSFQPSELLKFTLLLYLASFIAERIRLKKMSDRSFTTYPVLGIIAAIGLLIVVLQRDLGTMFSVVAIVASILFVGGLRWRDLGLVAGSLAGAGALSIALFPHRLARVLTFLNPSEDISGSSYHINQALIAVGSGGFFGKGLGRSVQVYGYLPEAETDSIFAITAEKFGFIGSLLILFIYVALFVRMLKIINRAPNTYFKLIGAGIFAWLFSHTVINIGAMLGILPLTGITLPLLSLGGSSMMFIMAGIGLMFNISRYTKLGEQVSSKEETRANSSRGRRNRRTRYAYSSSSNRA